MEANYPEAIPERLSDREITDRLKRASRLRRKHASYYDWPDKAVKEGGIVRCFLDPDNHRGQHSFTCGRLPEPGRDPPDAWVCSPGNRETALEVIELVVENAITAQIDGDRHSQESEEARWSHPTYFEDQVNDRIRTKDDKCDKLFARHPVQLLLHSDETCVAECYRDHLQSVEIDARRFDRVWLLLSYDPTTENCPLAELAAHN